jgi:hypothetical protein
MSGSYRYFTGDQTLTTGTPVALTHGLGARPWRIWAEIKCMATDIGYAVGDIVAVNPNLESDGSVVRGMTVNSDATTLRIIGGNNVAIWTANKTTGVTAAITPASWRYRAYAEA